MRLDGAFKGRELSKKLQEALEKKDRPAAVKVLGSLEKRAETSTQQKALNEIGSCLLKFWVSLLPLWKKTALTGAQNPWSRMCLPDP